MGVLVRLLHTATAALGLAFYLHAFLSRSQVLLAKEKDCARIREACTAAHGRPGR